ncbi:hypothetical protein HPO96_35600 [Kribbella sandramycini]|uniref:Uncharacterized protein n=1 Tax=Kribbella sandramycini TaxID=60450 RepID=A0A7Y4L8Z8_9ACTN|nr:hypothetical protein [Kribbella sandramycini]MBB6568812.1 hypothetical protein [Kribbella sandramycini]NOL45581.1 hypothetical protein [Kribbella sandramycini]
MASWRDTASEEAQETLDGLFSTALDLAEQQIGKQGGFAPFALHVTAEGDGSIEMADEPDSDKALEILWSGAREQRDKLAAVAVVVDVSLPDDGWADGIRVEAEHREGVALIVVAPYRRKRLRRSVELGQFRSVPGEQRVW